MEDYQNSSYGPVSSWSSLAQFFVSAPAVLISDIVLVAKSEMRMDYRFDQHESKVTLVSIINLKWTDLITFTLKHLPT